MGTPQSIITKRKLISSRMFKFFLLLPVTYYPKFLWTSQTVSPTTMKDNCNFYKAVKQHVIHCTLLNMYSGLVNSERETITLTAAYVGLLFTLHIIFWLFSSFHFIFSCDASDFPLHWCVCFRIIVVLHLLISARDKQKPSLDTSSIKSDDQNLSKWTSRPKSKGSREVLSLQDWLTLLLYPSFLNNVRHKISEANNFSMAINEQIFIIFPTQPRNQIPFTVSSKFGSTVLISPKKQRIHIWYKRWMVEPGLLKCQAVL